MFISSKGFCFSKLFGGEDRKLRGVIAGKLSLKNVERGGEFRAD